MMDKKKLLETPCDFLRQYIPFQFGASNKEKVYLVLTWSNACYVQGVTKFFVWIWKYEGIEPLLGLCHLCITTDAPDKAHWLHLVTSLSCEVLLKWVAITMLRLVRRERLVLFFTQVFCQRLCFKFRNRQAVMLCLCCLVCLVLYLRKKYRCFTVIICTWLLERPLCKLFLRILRLEVKTSGNGSSFSCHCQEQNSQISYHLVFQI